MRENHPKDYVQERYNPDKQPRGDRDCRLGCKRKRNRSAAEGNGEFVLAGFTQTFDKGDTSYFFPSMTQVEQRLRRRPRYGALDMAFDAHYVYD